MKELANLKEIKSKKIKITSVPNDITLEVGMSHPNVIPLRQRLFELNIHQDTSNSETFDKELLKSVMLFQEYSGLEVAAPERLTGEQGIVYIVHSTRYYVCTMCTMYK